MQVGTATVKIYKIGEVQSEVLNGDCCLLKVAEIKRESYILSSMADGKYTRLRNYKFI